MRYGSSDSIQRFIIRGITPRFRYTSRRERVSEPVGRDPRPVPRPAGSTGDRGEKRSGRDRLARLRSPRARADGKADPIAARQRRRGNVEYAHSPGPSQLSRGDRRQGKGRSHPQVRR